MQTLFYFLVNFLHELHVTFLILFVSSNFILLFVEIFRHGKSKATYKQIFLPIKLPKARNSSNLDMCLKNELLELKNIPNQI